MTTLFLHYYFVPQKSYFGCAYLMNFHEDFDRADHIGTEAIQETYDRLFEKWKNNLPLLRELSHVLNHRIGFWDDMYRKDPSNKQYLKFSLLYLDLFEKSYKYLMRKKHYRTRKNWQILE